MAEEGLPWARRRHQVFGTIELTEDDPRAEVPPGFRGNLWLPQATLLQAMLDLEGRPALAVYPADESDEVFRRATAPLLQTRSARIAAEFSFGKTVLCIALVCASRRPRALPSPVNLLAMDGGPSKNHLAVVRNRTGQRDYKFCVGGRGVAPQLEARYSRLIEATLVVAAPAVISQWEACIKEFAPGLKSFTIADAKTLRQFEAIFTGADPALPALREIDLVLLKAGKVTTSFTVAGEPKPEAKQRALTQALAMLTEGHVWSRMIVDDFDTIQLASSDCFLPALFSWVISATYRSTMVKHKIAAAPTAAEFIRANWTVPLLGAASDTLYDHVLKLSCESRYVEQHIHTTAMAFRQIIVEGGHAVAILQDLGVPADVLEMAAAGAVETAAERLSIKVHTVGELVERVLAARVEKYRAAVRVLDRVRQARAAADAAEGPPLDEDLVTALRKTLKSGSDAAAAAAIAALGRPSLRFKDAMSSLADWAENEMEEHGGRLRRMRENVRQNQCQACMVPIDPAGASYIVNCCQIVVCGFCTVVGEGRQRRYITRCPNCAAAVDPARHLIYVGADLGLDGALTDEALLAPAEAAPEAAAPEAVEPDGAPAPAGAAPDGAPAPAAYAAWDNDPRLRALLQLLKGDPIQCVSDGPVPPPLTGLLEGRRVVAHPAGAPHRYLIFAMHPESMRQIEAGLARAGVAYVRLQGTRAHKDEVVGRFKSGETHVLLATSSRDCAGLHLPEVTRVVLYHHHHDVQIAKQAVGRAQRIGRTESLEVVILVNEGEAAMVGGPQ